MLFYTYKSDDKYDAEDNINGRLHINKDDFKLLEQYAKKCDELRFGNINKMRTNELLIENDDNKNALKSNLLNNNDININTNDNYSQKNSANLSNPYKRKKKNINNIDCVRSSRSATSWSPRLSSPTTTVNVPPTTIATGWNAWAYAPIYII